MANKGRRRRGLAPEECRRVSVVTVETVGGLGDVERSVIETYRFGTMWKTTIDQIDAKGESDRMELGHAECECIARQRASIIKEGRSLRASEAAAARRGQADAPPDASH